MDFVSPDDAMANALSALALKRGCAVPFDEQAGADILHPLWRNSGNGLPSGISQKQTVSVFLALIETVLPGGNFEGLRASRRRNPPDFCICIKSFRYKLALRYIW